MAIIKIGQLPERIELNEIVNQCYSNYLNEILDAVEKNQSILIECDKIIVNHLIIAIRNLNKDRAKNTAFEIIDHRNGDFGPTMNTSNALTAAVRSFSEKVAEIDYQSSAIIVPNFDLLVSSDQTNTHIDLTTRDIMAIIHENPDIVIIAFKDPNLNIPKTVSSFFPKQIEIIGIDRVFMPFLITQEEAKRINISDFDPYQLYKYVSGLNVVKLRKILQGFTSNQYMDGMGDKMLNEIRKATISDAEAELPSVLISQIGGYENVKKILKEDVLGLLKFIQDKAETSEIEEIKELEKLIPRNILFTGPPGTGKTFFCKALATELNATIFIINGPELKNKWVGESERAIRNIFIKARKCAPSLIIFDEIDSFGRERNLSDSSISNSSSGATTSDNSMLNQLLTEMDGFNSGEMVFTIATTNLASSLDNALLSRFKYQIDIPYPEAIDRRAIMKVYDKIFKLNLTKKIMDVIIEETELWIDQNKWTRFAGRDLEDLASALARFRVIESYKTKMKVLDIPITKELVISEIHRKIRTKPLKIVFDDIGGYIDVKDKLKNEILKVLNLTKGMSVSERIKIEKLIPKGIIFEGPPGTGKTMFAKALANELEATVSLVSGPELKGSLVGQTEERIRKIFEEARKNAPSVIVFDEIDSIASSRSSRLSSNHEHSVVNQLLTEMDGISEKGLVFVVATTNFSKSIDKALKRPGRFEYIIHIPYPDEDARREILSIYNKKYKLNLNKESIEHLIFRTDNWVDPEAGIRFSGDHIEAVCRAIARKRLMKSNWKISKDNLDKIISQRTKKPINVSYEEEIVIATHEAGHAIISMFVEGCRPIKRISIASEYDGSLGYVLHEEMENKFVQNQEEILAEICCLMGGRIAEKKLLGKIATGGANDIEKATLMATHIAASFGMDENIGSRLILHPMIHGTKAANSSSPELLKKVEHAVDRIIKEQEDKALKCIEKNWDEFNKLREELLEKKVVEFKDYDRK